MATSVNEATILGHVGKDPEAKGESQFAVFSVATSERWKDRESGEDREKTEWHQITVFAPGLAKFLLENLKKGQRVYIRGMIETRKWQDRDGADRYSTGIVVKSGYTGHSVIILDKREGGGRRPEPPTEAYEDRSSPSRGRSSGGSLSEELDDEIPF